MVNKLPAIKHRRKLRSVLVGLGISQADIARKARVRPSAVSAVMGGYKTSKNVRQVMAKMLHVKVEDIWPVINVAKIRRVNK